MTICYLELLADLTHFWIGLSEIMSENYWPCQPSQPSQRCVNCVPCAQRIPQLLEPAYFFASCAGDDIPIFSTSLAAGGIPLLVPWDGPVLPWPCILQCNCGIGAHR